MIDLPSEHLSTVKHILQQVAPGVTVFAFGSRVNGRAKKYSDLDLGLEAQQSLDWRQMARLREAFEESDLPIRVDVVDWAACSPTFKTNVGVRVPILQNT